MLTTEEISVRTSLKTEDISVHINASISPKRQESSSFVNCVNKELDFEKFLKSKCNPNKEDAEVESVPAEDENSLTEHQNLENRKRYLSTNKITEIYDQRKRMKMMRSSVVDEEFTDDSPDPLVRDINSLESHISDQCIKEAQFEYSILKAINI